MTELGEGTECKLTINLDKRSEEEVTLEVPGQKQEARRKKHLQSNSKTPNNGVKEILKKNQMAQESLMTPTSNMQPFKDLPLHY